MRKFIIVVITIFLFAIIMNFINFLYFKSEFINISNDAHLFLSMLCIYGFDIITVSIIQYPYTGLKNKTKLLKFTLITVVWLVVFYYLYGSIEIAMLPDFPD